MTFAFAVSLIVALSTVGGAHGLAPNHPQRVVCYLSSEAFFLPGKGKFDIKDAKPALYMCTHLVYTYAEIDGATYEVQSRKPFRDFDLGGINQTVALKKKFPYLKTLIGVGGPEDDTTYYSKMAADPALRLTFAQSAVTFVLENGLDGMDFDWRSPADNDEEKANFVEVVKELRQKFNEHNFLLSLVVPGIVTNTVRGIDAKGLSDHVHFLNVLFNEYRDNPTVVYPNAPLRAKDKADVPGGIRFYLESDVPPEKINLGLFSYGSNFILANPNTGGKIMGSPVKGSGFNGPYNNVEGFTAINELCEEKEKGGWVEKWDEYSRTPYTVNGDRVVSHENAQSISEKVWYAMNQKLGGVAYFGLEKDDFRGNCAASKGKYPLLRNIDKSLVHHSRLAYQDILLFTEDSDASFFWNGMIMKNVYEDEKNEYFF